MEPETTSPADQDAFTCLAAFSPLDSTRFSLRVARVSGYGGGMAKYWFDTIKAAAPLKADARLDGLVSAARAYRMTPAERFEQRVSFVWAQMADGSDAPSKDAVRNHLRDRTPFPTR